MAIPRIRIVDSGSGSPAAFPSSVAASPATGPLPSATPLAAPPATPAPATPAAAITASVAPPASSPLTTFDRPIPVVVVGPRPLPVIGENLGQSATPNPGGPKGKTEQQPKGSRAARWKRRGMAVARGGGVAAVGAARNDFMPAFAVAVEGAVRGLDTLGAAGRASAAGLGTFAEAIKAGVATIDAFAQRGRELSGLSPELAAASARADVTRLQADLREANDLGPQMAQLIDNQAKAEATMRELWMPIKGFILDALNSFLQAFLDSARGILEGMNKLLSKVGLESDKITAVIKRIEEILTGATAIDPLEAWMRATEKWVAPKPAGEFPAAEGPAAPAPGLGVPFLADVLPGAFRIGG